jgi:hypothetical protein
VNKYEATNARREREHEQKRGKPVRTVWSERAKKLTKTARIFLAKRLWWAREYYKVVHNAAERHAHREARESISAIWSHVYHKLYYSLPEKYLSDDQRAPFGKNGDLDFLCSSEIDRILIQGKEPA